MCSMVEREPEVGLLGDIDAEATLTLIDSNNNKDKMRANQIAAKLNGLSLDTDAIALVYEDDETDSSTRDGSTSREGSEEPKTSDADSENTSEADLMEYAPMLQDLEAVCTIGTGTFGRVQLTRHRETKKHYALKVLNMHKLVTTRQVEHVHNEKHILNLIQHPFIVNLHATERDERNLYMIMEFVPGGELFSYLRAARRFSLPMATFYAAEITSALSFLHSKNIVYRDLKPENLMLTKEGHIKMADFGFAKELRDRTYTLCGTPEYLAPESVAKKGHNKAVDWWALGILIYEMLVGKPPFVGKCAQQIYAAILEHNLKFPRSFDLVAKDLVRKLLEEDRTRRLGCMKGGAEDVMGHRFFSHINWDDVETMRLTPPIVPTLYHAGDTGNFDSYEENTDPGPVGTKEELKLFENW
ncbi:unnamed protein product, partial [Mesorhabditis spiculigera]